MPQTLPWRVPKVSGDVQIQWLSCSGLWRTHLDKFSKRCDTPLSQVRFCRTAGSYGRAHAVLQIGSRPHGTARLYGQAPQIEKLVPISWIGRFLRPGSRRSEGPTECSRGWSADVVYRHGTHGNQPPRFEPRRGDRLLDFPRIRSLLTELQSFCPRNPRAAPAASLWATHDRPCGPEDRAYSGSYGPIRRHILYRHLRGSWDLGRYPGARPPSLTRWRPSPPAILYRPSRA